MQKPIKPAQFAENQLLSAIINAKYKPGEALPAERMLSTALGVTRPTLRETLQRLSREGWVTIRHGKPTIVNDYLKEGGLITLKSLACFGKQLSSDLVSNLLEVRTTMMPGIARQAVKRNPVIVADYLEKYKDLADEADKVADFDWGLQMTIVRATQNSVFQLILNDFTPLYEALSKVYFQDKMARNASFTYYAELEKAIPMGEDAAEKVVKHIMEYTHNLWINTHGNK
ncbi:MAG: fatty acid metabolism transcriptional regulator FadR [Desulfobacteraceae bacterium]|nr:fatty acid metabolism transcriptional regulator FadR [Desulfobacteraceae bacterium]